MSADGKRSGVEQEHILGGAIEIDDAVPSHASTSLISSPRVCVDSSPQGTLFIIFKEGFDTALVSELKLFVRTLYL